MAVIAGARAFHQVRATVRAGFMPVMKVSWITSPLCLAFAQKFLPEQTWVPFFNIVSFIIGTYINAHTKKKRLAALRRKVRLNPHAPVNSIMFARQHSLDTCALTTSVSTWFVADEYSSTMGMVEAHLEGKTISNGATTS